MKERLRKKRFGIVMMLPAFFAIVLLKMYPIVQGIWYAFTNRRMDRPESFVKFVGLKNIIDVFQDKNVQSTVLFTFEYAIGIVAVSYVIGLMLALLLNRDIKGRGFYRALVLLPWVVSNTVAAANFRWILNDRYGFINTTLQKLGLIEKPIQFLANMTNAKLTVIALGIWKTVPFMCIVILAALQAVPKDQYEAAAIDGAGYWKKLRYITLPAIRSVTVMATTLQFIWNFNNFEPIWLLTSGGPNEATQTLAVQIYEEAFVKNRIGYAAAIAVVVLIFMMIVTLLRLKMSDGRDQ